MSWPSGAVTLCRHTTFQSLSQMHRHLKSADQGHMLPCSRSHMFLLECQEYFKSTGEEDMGFRGSSGCQQDRLHRSSTQEILKTTCDTEHERGNFGLEELWMKAQSQITIASRKYLFTKFRLHLTFCFLSDPQGLQTWPCPCIIHPCSFTWATLSLQSNTEPHCTEPRKR